MVRNVGRGASRTTAWGMLLAAFVAAPSAGCPRPLPPPPPPPPPVSPVEPAPPPPVAPAPAPALSEDALQRLADAAAWLLDEEGPPVRLRLFVPDPATSSSGTFDAGLVAAVEALEGAAPRLLRTDVSIGPQDQDAVTALRGLGVLPRTGGDPDAVRALVVALGDRLTPVSDLSPERGRPAVQVLLAMHRVIRGPVQVGVLAAPGTSIDALVAGLSDFALARVDATSATGLAALIVLADGAGPLPADAKRAVDAMLAAGGGVLILGGRNAARDGRGAFELAASPSDPSRLLAGTGMSLGGDVVVDPSCARVSVPSGPGRLFLSYPPFVRAQVRLPGGAGEATGVFPFASPIRIEDGAAVEVLARSSADGWLENGEGGWDPSRTWRPPDSTASQVLAAAVRLPGDPDGGGGGRLVVVSTARVADGDGLTLDGNAAILAALVAWVADVEDVLMLGPEETNEP
ncbi:MAG: hypothetical protein HY907_12020 [Deltaproteobacteria bacterium]|nr:hypothetical protein [Deltaproteobacteria bacterium]